MLRLFLAVGLGGLCLPSAALGQSISGKLHSGARWTAERPDNWNGTLLLWSRGYSFNVPRPEAAPASVRAELLKGGYALAGSDYGASGWSLEEAIPAQLGTLVAFSARFGKPKRVIAWGYSMGGLVTTALAEQRPARIDGGAAFCSSIGGAVGMMNMGLDGAYAFKTLIAPGSDIRIVGIDDDMKNAGRVRWHLDRAMTSPAGRARVALAGVLAGIPDWTIPNSAAPVRGHHDEIARQIAAAFASGVFLPRVDQERRAGGIFSWNTGIDYRRQLRRSGRGDLVRALYRNAGLNLETDLQRLNAGNRVAAAPGAVSYMMRNYTPSARPSVPLVAVQAIGDGLTSPALQSAYATAASGDVKSLWLPQAGHCNFKADAVVAGLNYLHGRLQSRTWPARPSHFVDFRLAPMLRQCWRGRNCR